MDSPDPSSSSDFDSTSLPYAPHGADDASDSYDEWGQAKWGGVGQGAPLDENGRYIYSQVGMPVVPSSPLPSPPWVVPTSGDMMLVRESSSHNEAHVDETVVPGSDAVHHRLTLKRQRSDEEIETPLQTPRRGFGGLLTNTTRASSVPIQPPRLAKRRRLQSPFNISSTEHYLEGAMKELQQDMKAALCKQTEILSAILEEVRGQNMNLKS